MNMATKFKTTLWSHSSEWNFKNCHLSLEYSKTRSRKLSFLEKYAEIHKLIT